MRAALITLSSGLALLVSTRVLAQQEQDADGVTEKAVKMEELPRPVAETLGKAVGNNKADEIAAISYEGVVVLYEAEFTKDGKETEIVIRPWGELVTGLAAEDDDPDEEGEDDDAGAQLAGAQEEDAVQEKRIEMSALPKPVADAFRKELGAGPYQEIEQISYEGIVILYEAESDKGEMAVFPNGHVAQPLGQDDDDDNDEDEDDDDDVL